MNIEELWNKALKNTQIVRSYLPRLSTFGSTDLPFIFLAESEVNLGNTVVRRGKITAEKPIIFLPENNPQFFGFNFEEDLKVDTETIKSFLMIRGVSFPSLKYTHSSEIEVYEGKLDDAVEKHKNELAIKENIETGLVIGLSDCWQFSILIYVSSLIMKSAPNDFEKFIRKFNDFSGRN